jgi:hypothetical protein
MDFGQLLQPLLHKRTPPGEILKKGGFRGTQSG